MARPLKNIDKQVFENLCALQCTIMEMCDFLDVDDKTLTSWCKRTYKKSFSEIFRIKKGKGKISLRRTGFQMAERVPAVWIFLAKNFLGMSDVPQVNHDRVKAIAEALDKIEIEIV